MNAWKTASGCFSPGWAIPKINSGRKFTILIDRKGAEPLRKQVDVFGKDDETVIVAECKASGSFSRRSLQKDIEEFANLKKPIASAIRKHYGEDNKLKIIWLFVTENIIWSTPDKQRASGEQIPKPWNRTTEYLPMSQASPQRLFTAR